MSGKLARGSTLVLVLFIMLVAMVITTTVTTVVLNNLRTTIAFNQHAHGLYAMESGVERVLYYTQYARSNETIGAEKTAADTTGLTGDLDNKASYVTAVTVENAPAIDLAEGETVQWDFYEEDYTAGYRLVPITDLDTIVITWSEASACSSGTSQIEVSFSSWTEFNWEDISDPGTVQTHFTATCGASCSYTLGVDSSHLYKVRVKSLNCDISDVEATPYDTYGAVLDVANTMNISATGEYGEVSRTGGATVPWNPALAKYFEFVLFSEEPVSK
ncbi:MAG: hypothetical protein ACD_41C00016G0003 [uncultured bacterium]|nr:MAG: hypothetical protein ACD_41C00016G0003 [uncultured bacterium]HBY73550.1 hypothetical protein [Candidatus Kerfeldbacteria bacterium]